MSKKESKPISKDKQIAKLKRELKAAKLREVNNARVFAYALDLYRPDPPNILGAKSTPAQELLTLAVKISDQHANSRITVTASPDGTTSVSIEPATPRITTEEPKAIEKENLALDTEFWDREGRTFSATAYVKDKGDQNQQGIPMQVTVKGVDWATADLNAADTLIKVSEAYAKDKAEKPIGPKIIKPNDSDGPASEPAKEPAIKFISRIGFSYSLAEILFLREKPQGMALSEWHTVELIQRNYLGTKALQKAASLVTIDLGDRNAIKRLNEAFTDAGFQPVVDATQAKLDTLGDGLKQAGVPN